MTSPLRYVDRLQGTRLATRLAALPVTERLYQASRAVLVQDRLRFALSELAHRPGIHTYGLRGAQPSVAIRHDVPDVIVLDELFWWGFYDPPEAVARRLPAPGDTAAPRIVDLGANVGLFGVWCLRRWPRATIVAVEPDLENAAVCRRAVAANDAGDQWELVTACAGIAPGAVHFTAGQGAQSRVVDGGGPGIVSVPVVDAFGLLSGADVVKIDIEGSEWPLLADPRLATIDTEAILLEYHPNGAPSGDPHADAIRLLRAAGYGEFEVRRMPNDHGILWAWRDR